LTFDVFVGICSIATLVLTIYGLWQKWKEKEAELTPVLVDGEIQSHGDYLAVRFAFLGRGRYIMIKSALASDCELAPADPRRLNVDLMVPSDDFAPYLDISLPILPGTTQAAEVFFCIRSKTPGNVNIQFTIADRSRRVRYQITALPNTKTSTERYNIISR
jgi:hypothetical protein